MENVFNEAVQLGTFADPIAAVALFRRVLAGHNLFPCRSAGTMLVQSLAQSGDFENALGLPEDLSCEVGGAQVVVHCASDPVVQRRAMAVARERWRAHRKHPDSHQGHFAEQDFFHLFSRHWRKLAAADQESWLDEILHARYRPQPGDSCRLWGDLRTAFHAGFASIRDLERCSAH